MTAMQHSLMSRRAIGTEPATDAGDESRLSARASFGLWIALSVVGWAVVLGSAYTVL